jgi:phosphopantetheine--protein transferase-like protein
VAVTPIFVGNDVVDLREPAAKAAAQNGRFIERVFTDQERAAIAVASDPAAMLWTLFGAKEAGYKVVAKMLPGTAFAHRRFEVSPELDELYYQHVRLRLSIDVTPDRVHVVARPHRCAHVAEVSPLPPGADPGAAARGLLKAAMAALIGCSSADLEIVREKVSGSWDGFGPPLLVRGGRPVEADVSLSHDGAFVAFAAAGAMLSVSEG